MGSPKTQKLTKSIEVAPKQRSSPKKKNTSQKGKRKKKVVTPPVQIENRFEKRILRTTMLALGMCLAQLLFAYAGVVPVGFNTFIKYHPDKAAIAVCRTLFQDKAPDYVQRCIDR